ncbi:MAG: hypothetical protein WD688_26815 [Candidatus Binatia bacterium]
MPDRLTSDQEGAKISAMKRTAKNLVAFGLVLFFALGVLCVTLAFPGQSLASVTGCSQDNRAMQMTDCEHPSYLCGFDRSSHLLSQGALSSTRSSDSLKSSLGVAVGEACFDSSAYAGAFVGNEHTNAFPAGPQKVSIHLYNSVLNL